MQNIIKMPLHSSFSGKPFAIKYVRTNTVISIVKKDEMKALIMRSCVMGS